MWRWVSMRRGSYQLPNLSPSLNLIPPVRAPCVNPATSFANVHTHAYIHADVIVSRQLAHGHAACDSTCASLYGDRAEMPYGNMAPEGIYCKRPYPRYDYMIADSADCLYTDAYCQLICCPSLFFTPTLNVNSFLLLTYGRQRVANIHR